MFEETEPGSTRSSKIFITNWGAYVEIEYRQLFGYEEGEATLLPREFCR